MRNTKNTGKGNQAMASRLLYGSWPLKNAWLIGGAFMGFVCIPLPADATGKRVEENYQTYQSLKQDRTVTGQVVDESGEPLIGVSIHIKGTTQGTITDINGNFSVDASSGDEVFIVSYIGYKTQELRVGDRQQLHIVLESDNEILDEVVVVGYGVVRKSDLTGAVGSVKAETISAKGSTSVMESLQGQVAGVNISQSSSRAGAGFSMQIRGKSSLNGGEPLYVVDGVVCDNTGFLNPMDIEKVDILKDASSTAIYGSRATNGVVMITTKAGTVGATKTTVSYDGYYGVKTVANMSDFMSGDQWMDYRFFRYLVPNEELTSWEMDEANFKNFWGADSPVVKEIYRNKTYTDWADVVTRSGSQQNHFVNISGNVKDISYRIGLGYQQEEGVMYDAYERWNIKGAFDHKISDKLSVGFMTNMATSLTHNGSKNSVLNGFRMSPILPSHYTSGENAGQPILQPGKDEVTYPYGGGPTSTLNPVIDRENAKDDTRSYDAMANLYLQYSPVKSVILKTTFAPMYTKGHQGTFYNEQTEYRVGKSNMAESINTEWFSYTWDTQANYIKTWDEHSLNVLALTSVYQRTGRGDKMVVTDMPFDVDWHNLGSGTIQEQSSWYKRVSMLSYVGRINYSYKDRYLLTASARWDGSSKFQKDNRWGMFPSAAVAWRIGEESFMESAKSWLSNLKLRASFGITGNNDGIDAYDTQALANVKYYYNYGSTPANGYGYTLTNANLTWEKTTELNLGIDFGFFDNRITGAIDVYNKNSRDLLMEMKTPYEMGSNTGSIVSNVGKVNNKGIEIQLNTINFSNKDWHWETSFSFARNINTIRELNDAKEDLVGNKWFIGRAIDVVYGYKYLGVCTREEAEAYANDPKMKTKFHEGEMKIYDRNGDGVINAEDKMVLGHAAPTWTGSLTSNITYKNIDFSFSIYFSQGSRVFSPFMGEYQDYDQRGMQRLAMDFYIPEGAPVLAADGSISTQEKTYYGSYPFPTNGGNGKGGWLFLADGGAGRSFAELCKQFVCPGKEYYSGVYVAEEMAFQIQCLPATCIRKYTESVYFYQLQRI
ncbi:MAG: TonB-dependent receptor [Bacteroides sp.]|nr:TonB-dependent receptor [Bacteroides sp.]